MNHKLFKLMEEVVLKMLMVLCTLFIHINIIPTRQEIHLILTEYYSEHNVYVFALAGARTPIARVRVYHANQYTTNASCILFLCISCISCFHVYYFHVFYLVNKQIIIRFATVVHNLTTFQGQIMS